MLAQNSLFTTIIILLVLNGVRCYLELSPSLQAPASRPLQKQDGKGSPYGTPFDDIQSAKEKTNLTLVNILQITINYNETVNSIQVDYYLSSGHVFHAPVRGVTRPYPSGHSDYISLTRDESHAYVSKISANTNGTVVSNLNISITYTGGGTFTHGPYGKRIGDTDFVLEGHIVALYGRAEHYLDYIGAYSLPVAKKSPFCGYVDGRGFSTNPDWSYPAPILGISKLLVLHYDGISGLQVEYKLLGGGTKISDMHGNGSGNLTVITFDSDEALIGFKGQYQEGAGTWIATLTFVTSINGSVKHYGPFGTQKGSGEFSFVGNGTIVSFGGVYVNGWDLGLSGILAYYYTV